MKRQTRATKSISGLLPDDSRGLKVSLVQRAKMRIRNDKRVKVKEVKSSTDSAEIAKQRTADRKIFEAKLRAKAEKAEAEAKVQLEIDRVLKLREDELKKAKEALEHKAYSDRSIENRKAYVISRNKKLLAKGIDPATVPIRKRANNKVTDPKLEWAIFNNEELGHNPQPKEKPPLSSTTTETDYSTLKELDLSVGGLKMVTYNSNVEVVANITNRLFNGQYSYYSRQDLITGRTENFFRHVDGRTDFLPIIEGIMELALFGNFAINATALRYSILGVGFSVYQDFSDFENVQVEKLARVLNWLNHIVDDILLKKAGIHAGIDPVTLKELASMSGII